MIKVVIINDKKNTVKSIDLIIKEHFPILKVVGRADSSIEGKKAILNHQPDLIFLEVEMPNKSGFDLLEMLPNKKFELVFTTTNKDLFTKAFKYSAINFIVKPIDTNEFIDTITKIQKQIMQKDLSDKENIYQKNYEILLDNIKSSKPRKISLPTSRKQIFLDINDISIIESEDNYSILHASNKRKILILKNIKEFENILSDSFFFRTDDSYLINILHIKKHLIKNGRYILMPNNFMVPISQRRKDFFLDQIQKHINH